MVALAIETVTRAGSIALAGAGDADRAVAGDARRTHGERLPGDVLTLLAEARRTLADVDLFAVVAGPGSFTGLRVGMAAVQGLTIATGRAIVPVPTLDAMALGWTRHAAPPPGTVVVACLDGHRSEVFGAAWRVTDPRPAAMEDQLLEPRVSDPAAFAEAVRALPSGAGVVIVGDGARRHAATFGDVRIEDVPVTLAAVAARYALDHPDRAVRPHALRPIYIRRPDAVIARERAAAAQRPPRP